KTHQLSFGDLDANENGIFVAAIRNTHPSCSTRSDAKFANLGPGDEILVFVKRTAANTYAASFVYRNGLQRLGAYWSHPFTTCNHPVQRNNPRARLSDPTHPLSD